MNASPQAIPDVLLISPRVFSDARGYFFESWSDERSPIGDLRFVQDNVSVSQRGVIRGLHLQNPRAQGKLITAITGCIWDVAVDVRVGSPSFGQYVAAELSEDNHHQLYIRAGFAHGFCVLSELAHVVYKCTDYYEPASELSILYSDAELAIPWPAEKPQLSLKDAQAPSLRELLGRGSLPRYAPSHVA